MPSSAERNSDACSHRHHVMTETERPRTTSSSLTAKSAAASPDPPASPDDRKIVAAKPCQKIGIAQRDCRRPANCLSNSSLATCPSVSLTCAKPSRSSRSRRTIRRRCERTMTLPVSRSVSPGCLAGERIKTGQIGNLASLSLRDECRCGRINSRPDFRSGPIEKRSWCRPNRPYHPWSCCIRRDTPCHS